MRSQFLSAGELHHQLQPREVLPLPQILLGHAGIRICQERVLAARHRNIDIGQQLRIPAGEQGSDPATDVVASWYGQYHHGRIMANGEPYSMQGHTIAHRDMPLGTRTELENPETGEKARATVTDRGPYVEGRDVDLSYRLARKLSLSRQGVANLKMRVL